MIMTITSTSTSTSLYVYQFLGNSPAENYIADQEHAVKEEQQDRAG